MFEKVSFHIASEAIYVYILSGQKLIKSTKNGPFWGVFENVKLVVKQDYQTGQFVHSKCDILSHFQTMWTNTKLNIPYNNSTNMVLKKTIFGNSKNLAHLEPTKAY